MNFANRDQATSLRRINTSVPKTRAKVITVTSGKGGVGKTNVTINLACALANRGRRVFILDADFGLANIDVLLNLTPPYTIEDVLDGKKEIDDVVVEGPCQISILPASSGVGEMAELPPHEQKRLLEKLSQIQTPMDYLLIDTGAGIASSVLRFITTADKVLIVATSEPTSMTDAYSLMKILSERYSLKQFNILANQVNSKQEGDLVFERLNKVAYDFLQANLTYLGFILKDAHLIKAVRQQRPLLEVFPNAAASVCFHHLARHIDTPTFWESNYMTTQQAPSFWERVSLWKRKR